MNTSDCGFENERGWFRLRAAAIILEEGCVLLAQNVKDLYYYSIGGAVHLHESAEEAVLREVYEETGLHYEIDRLCFIHENFFKDVAGKPFHEVAFYFLMKPRGDLKLMGHDVSMYGDAEHAVWVPLPQLPHLYAFPTFFRERLGSLPAGAEVITTRETAAERRDLLALQPLNTAFRATDDLGDGVIRLRCAWRMERNQAINHVPVYRFDILLEEGGASAGLCELRLGNEQQLTWAGNIGYEIFEPFRGRRLAARACQLLFHLARAHGLPWVTITCETGNLASIRTAELAGAVYERTADIPEGHPMYAAGKRAVRVYKKTLG